MWEVLNREKTGKATKRKKTGAFKLRKLNKPELCSDVRRITSAFLRGLFSI
jgi:hypothetical protein